MDFLCSLLSTLKYLHFLNRQRFYLSHIKYSYFIIICSVGKFLHLSSPLLQLLAKPNSCVLHTPSVQIHKRYPQWLRTLAHLSNVCGYIITLLSSLHIYSGLGHEYVCVWETIQLALKDASSISKNVAENLEHLSHSY